MSTLAGCASLSASIPTTLPPVPVSSAARPDPPTSAMTRQQKTAMWVVVGVVAAYLIADWIEDNVAFFPE